MKTYHAKEGEIERKWHIIDASGKVVGRLSTEIATLLRGKHKPQFTPNTDTGDFVVVINADKVEFTGNKWDEKMYYRHSGWFGGIKERSAKLVREMDPAFILTEAVKGMLPKNKLSRQLIQKLKVYAGPEHPHQAQKPAAYQTAKQAEI
ncbi:MAG: 50S ribosomal protein L13 [Oligoflexia bacterium]|nr:50S ribosomal protein L13 [Oligoflexia bacterium]